MNEEQPTLKREHGTTASYITGFILSLLFTIVAYVLVVNHLITGNVLIAAIVTFALLQAAVQVFFFLHLGREKKPYWQSTFLVATVGAVFVVVVGSMWIMGHLHANMTPVTAADEAKQLVNDEGIAQVNGIKTGACEATHTNHQIVITNGQVSPYETTAHLCDTLTFINNDNPKREIGFGPHDHHTVYAGLYELDVYKGMPKTITLSEAGAYDFHDHLHEETAGKLTITR